MTSITSVPPEARARFPDLVREYTAVGLCTDPCDRPEAEAGIRQLYKHIGERTDIPVLWVESPLLGAYLTPAALIALAAHANVRATVRDIVLDNVHATVRANVLDNVLDTVHDTVHDTVLANVLATVRDIVRANVLDNVLANVHATVRANVLDTVHANVHATVRDIVLDNVHATVLNTVRANVLDTVHANVHATVRDNVRANVHATVRANVLDNVHDTVLNTVRANVHALWWRYIGGQYWVDWLAYIAALRLCGLSTPFPALDALDRVARAACWFWPTKHFVVVSERPRVLRRQAGTGRLHCIDGPAVSWGETFTLYFWRGQRVPAGYIEQRHERKAADILTESNAEMRRVLFEIHADVHGPGAALRDMGARLLAEDTEHGRPRKLYEVPGGARYVHVVNGSLEPDGTRREFLLGAHPAARTPHDAVAASYGRPAGRYSEALRT